MKKLTKLSLQELASKMPTIDENTQESCVGGNTYFDMQDGSLLSDDSYGSGIFVITYNYYVNNMLGDGSPYWYPKYMPDLGSGVLLSGIVYGECENLGDAPESVIQSVLEYYNRNTYQNVSFDIVTPAVGFSFSTRPDGTTIEFNIPSSTQINEDDLVNAFF